MDQAVRRFALNILLLHAALLLVVLGILFYASHEIEQSARDQALEQAHKRQQQLAAQTSKGIEGFYRNILDDMDLLPKSGATSAEMSVGPTTQPIERTVLPDLRTALPDIWTKTAPKSPLGNRGLVIGFVLARQLEDRVSHLFVLDKGDMVPHGLYREDLQDEVRPRPATRPATRPMFAMGTTTRPGPGGKVERQPPKLRPSGPMPTQAELDIVARRRAWFQQVTSQSVSGFEIFDAGGCNLVALPLGQNARTLLVAAVPVDKIVEKFLARLAPDKDNAVFLIDDHQVAMASSRAALVGIKLNEEADATLRDQLEEMRLNGYKRTLVMSQPFTIGGQTFGPSLLTAEPVEVLPGKRWYLLVASPLSEVDGIVKELFRRIILWTIFLTIAVTGILLSTAIRMIRSRARAERVRLETIHKELARARQIQQAWLPRDAPSSKAVDVAAVNYPAQHISGDFYNWFDLPDGRIAIAIGDVTGHGMSAAFLMATTQLLVRMTLMRLTDPGECLTEVNRQLCSQIFNGQFVTLQIVVLDPESETLELATAGHPAPMVAHPDAAGRLQVRELSLQPQFVLGVEEDATYASEVFRLAADSVLLLYTDGAADVEAPNGARLGTSGLLNAVNGRKADPRNLDAARFLDTIVTAVNGFRGSRALGDDLTLVAVRLKTAGRPVRRPEPVGAAPA